MRHSRRRLLANLAGVAAGLAVGAPSRANVGAPKRIVAAGGAVTEIAYALGRQDWIVGVDSTSQYPAAALAEKKNVGYLRALSAEGILSLRPDLIVAVEGAGPPDVLKLLAEAKVPSVLVPEALTEEGVTDRIRQVGEAFDAAAGGRALAERVGADFAGLAARRAQIGRKARVMFVLSSQSGRVLVGGRNSVADAIIGLAGATNAADTLEGFKMLSEEGIVSAAPEAIVMMNAGLGTPSVEGLFGQEAFRMTPAARGKALIVMDGLYLLGFGPRTPAAAGELMDRIAAATAR